MNIDPGFPFLSARSAAQPRSTGAASTLQAGLLTLGSSYLPRLPIRELANSDICAVFVPDYSGGPVSDLHGIPFYAPEGTWMVLGGKSRKRRQKSSSFKRFFRRSSPWGVRPAGSGPWCHPCRSPKLIFSSCFLTIPLLLQAPRSYFPDRRRHATPTAWKILPQQPTALVRTARVRLFSLRKTRARKLQNKVAANGLIALVEDWPGVKHRPAFTHLEIPGISSQKR